MRRIASAELIDSGYGTAREIASSLKRWIGSTSGSVGTVLRQDVVIAIRTVKDMQNKKKKMYCEKLCHGFFCLQKTSAVVAVVYVGRGRTVWRRNGRRAGSTGRRGVTWRARRRVLCHRRGWLGARVGTEWPGDRLTARSASRQETGRSPKRAAAPRPGCRPARLRECRPAEAEPCRRGRRPCNRPAGPAAHGRLCNPVPAIARAGHGSTTTVRRCCSRAGWWWSARTAGAACADHPPDCRRRWKFSAPMLFLAYPVPPAAVDGVARAER